MHLPLLSRYTHLSQEHVDHSLTCASLGRSEEAADEGREGVRQRHKELLAHQHVRYMWIPHTDTVVVVTCDPVAEDAKAPTLGEPVYVLDYNKLGLEPPAMPAAFADAKASALAGLRST